jgi:hypothetical protein
VKLITDYLYQKYRLLGFHSVCDLVVLATDPDARVRFPALPDFLTSESGTDSTQPREFN